MKDEKYVDGKEDFKQSIKIKTYNPEKKRKVSKEEAVPFVIDVGERFTRLGGLTSFFVSSFLLSIKSFFKAGRKVREFRAKREKTLDLR